MAVVVGVIAGGGTAAAAIPIYTHPDLELARTIVTNPFPGTTMKPSDAEGLAYVPSDNSIWLADDNGHRLVGSTPPAAHSSARSHRARWRRHRSTPPGRRRAPTRRRTGRP